MSVSVLRQPQNPLVGSHTCFHCHDTCPPMSAVEVERLSIGDKHFCCDGCRMVYEILHAHDMCTFYDLDQNAGQSLKSQKFIKNYAYLDDPEVREKLLEFDNGQTAQITFYLPTMHCVSCIWLLENLGKLDAGVTHSRVNFLKKTATVQFDPAQTSLRKLAALLASIGYAPDLNLNDVQGQKPPAMSRRIAYQLAVAGFAFGNVMLFSFPEYVGMDRAVDPWFFAVFGYTSLVLALPVLLFSARDYFASAWQGLRNRQLNIDVPLCLAFISLFGRSVWEILTHAGAGYLDSFTGLVFLMLIGKWFQQRVWYRLSFERDYKSYFPVAATVRNSEGETSVPVSRLVPGDIIIVRNQEIIPADGVLLKGSARVDYSFVTGESEPVAVNSGDRIFAGGKQLGESIEVALTRRVAQSHLTQLWNNEAFKTTAKGQVTQLADAAGRYFTLLILAFGGGAVAYWWLMRGDIPTAVNAFTAVMIVACPCNIALSIPFTLGNVMRLLGREGFYLKNIKVLEALARINTVVFDKTGTITNGAQPDMRYAGQPLSYAQKVAVRSLVRHSSHPLSRRLYECLPEVPVDAPEQFEEISGLGIRGVVNGSTVKIGSSAFVQDTNEPGVFIAVNGEVLGHYEVKSRLRDGLAEVLAFFRNDKLRVEGSGLKVEGSGLKVEGSTPAFDDAQPSTFNLQPSTSNFQPPTFNLQPSTSNLQPSTSTFLLSGDRDQEADLLAPHFPDADTMLFNRSPQDKLDFVKSLQRFGRRVLMLGDGLNDAGALQQSDVGIVVSENTNNFTPACDAILRADEFARLPQFVRMAQASVRIVNMSYIVALTYNSIGLSFGVSGSLSPLVAAVLMPISSISIVLFGVGMSNRAARRILRAAAPRP